MSVYADLTEEQLEAEIATLRQRIRDAGKSPTAGIKSIAGEGRRMEFFGSGGGTSTMDLRRLLREATDALAMLRGDSGSAIGVRY